MHRKLGAVFTGLCVVLTIVRPAVCADATEPEAARRTNVVVRLPLETVSVETGEDGRAVFSGGSPAGEVGHPALPRLTLRVLLPPNADLRSVRVRLEGEKVEELPGTWDVEPVPPTFILGTLNAVVEATNVAAWRNVAAYSTNSFQPASFLGWHRTGQMREWRLAEVQVSAFRYNPVAKRLLRLVEGSLAIDFARIPGMRRQQSLSAAMGARFREAVRRSAVNFEAGVGGYEGK